MKPRKTSEGSSNSEGHLVEKAAHYYQDGRKGIKLTWNLFEEEDDYRVLAVVTGRDILLKRELGSTGEIRVSLSELRLLDSLCRVWKPRCARWAAFEESFNGVSVSFNFYPPGAKAKPVNVGGRCIYVASKHGEQFKKKDSEKPLARPKELRPGILQTAELWRVGEKYGDPNGECVGIVCKVGERLSARLRRFDLELVRDDAKSRRGSSGKTVACPRTPELDDLDEESHSVAIEEGEEKFVASLLRYVNGRKDLLSGDKLEDSTKTTGSKIHSPSKRYPRE